MYGMDVNGVNNVTGINYTKSTSNIGKTDGFISFNSSPKEEGFYPGLCFSAEARMEAEMKNSPFINTLNAMFGI